MINRWLQNRVFLALVSFAIAFYCWQEVPENRGQNPFRAPVESDLRLVVKYDQERFELGEHLRALKITLSVKGSDWSSEDLHNNVTALVDLTGKAEGIYYNVPIQLAGLPPGRGIVTQLDPTSITVQLKPKMSRGAPVKLGFLHQLPDGRYSVVTSLPEGYSFRRRDVDPRQVYVRGVAEAVNRVAEVRALVPLPGSGQGAVHFEDVSLQALADDGTLVSDVQFLPDKVKVDVDLDEPMREVPLQLRMEPGPPEGYAVQSMTAYPSTLKFYGPLSALQQLPGVLPVDVNLANVRESTPVGMPVPINQFTGLNVVPRDVQISVSIGRALTKDVDQVRIRMAGTPKGTVRSIQGRTPREAEISVTLSGAPEAIKALKAKDVHAAVDVTDLQPGVHLVPLQVYLPGKPLIQVLKQSYTTLRIEIARE